MKAFLMPLAAMLLLALSSSCSKNATIVDPGGNKNPSSLTTGSTYRYYFTTRDIFGTVVTRDTLVRTIGLTGLTVDGKSGATEVIQTMKGQSDTSYIASEPNGDLSVWISTIDANLRYPQWISYPTVSKNPYSYTLNKSGLSGSEVTKYVTSGSRTIGTTEYSFSTVNFGAMTEFNDGGTTVTGSFDMNVDYSSKLLMPLSETGGNVFAPALGQYAKGSSTFLDATIR